VTVSCFDLVDVHVVGGHADDEALRDASTSWTYARLLEEVAAFGGVLRHCGVAAGDRVAVALPECAEAVVAVLASARIGAEPALDPPSYAGKVLVTASTEVAALGAAAAEVVLVRQRPDATWELREGRDYDWDVVMRAGRTDPAACLDDATLTPTDPRVEAWVAVLLDRGTIRLGG
jgi:acyl-CoA synthetase (AMP-forming)/AMP-acid ligase II